MIDVTYSSLANLIHEGHVAVPCSGDPAEILPHSKGGIERRFVARNAAMDALDRAHDAQMRAAGYHHTPFGWAA